jgi:hypothetical protein
MDLAQIKELILKQGSVASNYLQEVSEETLTPHTLKLDDREDSRAAVPAGAKSPILKIQEAKDGSSVLVQIQDDNSDTRTTQNPNRITLVTEDQSPTGTTRSRIQLYEELLAGREANNATRNTTATGQLVSPSKVLLPISSAVRDFLGSAPNPIPPLSNTVSRLMSMSMDYASPVAPAALPKPLVIDTSNKTIPTSANPITNFITNAQKAFDNFINTSLNIFGSNSSSNANPTNNQNNSTSLKQNSILDIKLPIFTSTTATEIPQNFAQNNTQLNRDPEPNLNFNTHTRSRNLMDDKREEKIWEDKRVTQEHTQQAALRELRAEAEKLNNSRESEKVKQARFNSYLDKLARYAGLDPNSFTSKRELLVAILNSGKPVDTLMSVFEKLGHNFGGVLSMLEKKGHAHLLSRAVVSGLQSINTSSAEYFALELGYSSPNLETIDKNSSLHPNSRIRADA